MDQLSDEDDEAISSSDAILRNVTSEKGEIGQESEQLKEGHEENNLQNYCQFTDLDGNDETDKGDTTDTISYDYDNYGRSSRTHYSGTDEEATTKLQLELEKDGTHVENNHVLVDTLPQEVDHEHFSLQNPPQNPQNRPFNCSNAANSNKKIHNNHLCDQLNPFRNLSWSLVGSYIVRYAPCFLLCVKRLGISATDRQILMRLNILSVFFAVIQIGIGTFLFLVTLVGVKTGKSNQHDFYGRNGDNGEPNQDDQDIQYPLVSPDLWSLALFVYMLSLLSVVVLVTSFFGQRALREVNLLSSVRFMWALLWLLPMQIFLMIGLFDYYRVMEVWTTHYWDDPSMSWFRNLFCAPGTAQGKCLVPIAGGIEFDNEEDWCFAYYNATDCRAIRDEAQLYYTVVSYIFFTSNGVWALLLVALMWVILNILQTIISLPIVQRSKEANIPIWLTLPTIGCFGIGGILLYGPGNVTESFTDLYWIALTYMISGGAFTLAALVGISLKCYTVLNKRQKKCKQAIVIFFIVTIFLTILSVATIFTTSLVYSLNIISIPTASFHKIACLLDFGGSCTGCDSTHEEMICPEWSEDDVTRVLKTIMKQSATVAAILLVYALITLRYGFLLFRHVSKYKIDYV